MRTYGLIATAPETNGQNEPQHDDYDLTDYVASCFQMYDDLCTEQPLGKGSDAHEAVDPTCPTEPLCTSTAPPAEGQQSVQEDENVEVAREADYEAPAKDFTRCEVTAEEATDMEDEEEYQDAAEDIEIDFDDDEIPQ